jgi:protein O-GlcNAc transferase
MPPVDVRASGAVEDPAAVLAICTAAIRGGQRDVGLFLQAVAAADRLGRPDEAERLARAATAMAPASWQVAYTLAAVLMRRRRLDEAAAATARVLGILGDGPVPPSIPVLLSDIATLMKEAGRLEEAIALYRRAVDCAPGVAWIHSNLLFCLSYLPGIPKDDLLEAHKAFGRLYARPVDLLDYPNDPDPDRRIRVGYVSPDFRRHVVATMIEDLFRHHDPDLYEVYCYAEVASPDAVTERLKGLVPHWRSTVGLSDADVVRMIRADRIDVLIDLAGHTANNRLPVFGHKPAPRQMTWLGYPNTTGMPTIDCIGNFLPQDQVVEMPVMMPVMTYHPPEDAPDPVPPSLLVRGSVTFGCFNNVAKLNDEVFGVWSRILHRVSDARLLLKAVGFADPNTRAWVAAAFAARGIDPVRLEFRGPSDRPAFMAEMADIDVALDPFPYGGSTTTLDSLWMGVPVVALDPGSDPRVTSRWLLRELGLGDLVRDDADGYVEAAVTLAADVERLTALRQDLRPRMERSALRDGVRYAREVEVILRRIWRWWVWLVEQGRKA